VHWTPADALNLNAASFAANQGWAVGPKGTIARFNSHISGRVGLEQLPRLVRLGFPAAFLPLRKLQKVRTHTNSRLIQRIAVHRKVDLAILQKQINHPALLQKVTVLAN